MSHPIKKIFLLLAILIFLTGCQNQISFEKKFICQQSARDSLKEVREGGIDVKGGYNKISVNLIETFYNKKKDSCIVAIFIGTESIVGNKTNTNKYHLVKDTLTNKTFYFKSEAEDKGWKGYHKIYNGMKAE